MISFRGICGDNASHIYKKNHNLQVMDVTLQIPSPRSEVRADSTRTSTISIRSDSLFIFY